MAVDERTAPSKPMPVPRDIDEKLKRGRKQMLRDAPSRRLCQRFERGDSYWYVNEKGLLDFQSTVTSANGSGKPRHRVRSKINLIRPIVEAKVSAATQRIPSYDVAPSTTDPKAEGAARMSEAVALYGYDKWMLRRAAEKTVKLAIVSGDGFALPYFDPDVGPYVQMDDGSFIGQGEIKVLVMSGNEVYWEAGTDFYLSSYYAVERAQPIASVKKLPGYVGGELAADATTSDIPSDNKDRDGLVMVTDYYERPSSKYPEGRTMHFANGRCITDARMYNPTATGPWEAYPVRDADGTVMDEPVLHRLSYTLDPETDHDLGLVWQLIDVQRTAQDAWNKATEWKNRCLNPQMKAPVGSLIDRPDDVPGSVRYYRPIGGLVPEWEQVQPIPDSLFRIFDQSQQIMRTIAADVDLDAANAAARTLQQIIEQSANRWQSFLGNEAEWHSRLMRHCLCLVARHYTEPRLLQIRGRFGPYSISDFQGSKLMGQVSVTVLPGSLQVRTKEQITQQVLAFADRGWVSPQVAMAAIQGGTAEKLIESYELDVARANRIIQSIVDGSVMNLGSWQVSDPMTGQSTAQPIFMPRESDNLEIWKSVFGDWLKTEQYQALDPAGQEATNLIYSGIMMLESQAQQKAMAAQSAQAAQLGMDNAAKPQSKGMPDLPGGTQDATQGAPPAAPAAP